MNTNIKEANKKIGILFLFEPESYVLMSPAGEVDSVLESDGEDDGNELDEPSSFDVA